MTTGLFHDTMVDLNWPELQDYVDRNALVLLPLGVIEEHGLVATQTAKALPPTQLGDDKIMAWLMGGQAQQLSPNGYLGAPADFEGADVLANIGDIADRISEAILKHRRKSERSVVEDQIDSSADDGNQTHG